VNRLWRDIAGSMLVEYTIVFPVFILVTLGTVDVAYMFADWAAANKAVYRGARKAIVSSPVAGGITDPRGNIGQWCFDFPSGSQTTPPNCPAVTASVSSSVCTPAAINGSCTNGRAWNETAFTNPTAVNDWQKGIFDKMQEIFPRLQRQDVQITYQTTGYGYAGQPGGLPMTVTVSLPCLTHQFYFLGALMNWAFAPRAGCTGPVSGPPMPTFATALTSEDMTTN
jgi:TadE-like protein